VLPDYFIKLVHSIRDQTFDRECELYRATGAGVGIPPVPVSGYVFVGLYACRLDAMASTSQGDNRVRRNLGLTLASEAPALVIGDVVRLNDVDYNVDTAEDERAELIIRRYTISVTEADFASAPVEVR